MTENTTNTILPIIKAEADPAPIMEPKDVESWTDVVAFVNTQNGVGVVKMGTLRDIDGYGRLGTSVRANIQKKLVALGLGTIRPDLPSDQNDNVLLYRLGTPAAELVDAVLLARAGGNLSKAAEGLRKVNVIPDPAAVRDGLQNALMALTETQNATTMEIHTR